MSNAHLFPSRDRPLWVPGRILQIMALLLPIASLPACSRQHNPQSAYDHAWKAFQQGDLARAEKETGRAYDDFHNGSPEWAWKFTILRARVLYERGLYDEVLKLLAAEPSAL